MIKPGYFAELKEHAEYRQMIIKEMKEEFKERIDEIKINVAEEVMGFVLEYKGEYAKLKWIDGYNPKCREVVKETIRRLKTKGDNK